MFEFSRDGIDVAMEGGGADGCATHLNARTTPTPQRNEQNSCRLDAHSSNYILPACHSPSSMCHPHSPRMAPCAAQRTHILRTSRLDWNCKSQQNSDRLHCRPLHPCIHVARLLTFARAHVRANEQTNESTNTHAHMRTPCIIQNGRCAREKWAAPTSLGRTGHLPTQSQVHCSRHTKAPSLLSSPLLSPQAKACSNCVPLYCRPTLNRLLLNPTAAQSDCRSI